jgi:hypothetical protein
LSTAGIGRWIGANDFGGEFFARGRLDADVVGAFHDMIASQDITIL